MLLKKHTVSMVSSFIDVLDFVKNNPAALKFLPASIELGDIVLRAQYN